MVVHALYSTWICSVEVGERWWGVLEDVDVSSGMVGMVGGVVDILIFYVCVLGLVSLFRFD